MTVYISRHRETLNLNSSSPACMSCPRLLLVRRLLHRRELNDLACPALKLFPQPNVPALIPRQDPDPRLDVVAQLQRDIGLGDLARGLCDVIFRLLILQRELTAVDRNSISNRMSANKIPHSTSRPPLEKLPRIATHRLGSTLLPAALLRNFFSAEGPMLARWSADGLVMMLSQMTA